MREIDASAFKISGCSSREVGFYSQHIAPHNCNCFRGSDALFWTLQIVMYRHIFR